MRIESPQDEAQKTKKAGPRKREPWTWNDLKLADGWGERLQELRQARHFTVASAARLLEISQPALLKYERASDPVVPPAALLIGAAHFLGCRVEWLIAGPRPGYSNKSEADYDFEDSYKVPHIAADLLRFLDELDETYRLARFMMEGSDKKYADEIQHVDDWRGRRLRAARLRLPRGESDSNRPRRPYEAPRRRAIGSLQADFAATLGLTKSEWSNLETNSQRPRRYLFYAIQAVHGIDYRFFTSGYGGFAIAENRYPLLDRKVVPHWQHLRADRRDVAKELMHPDNTAARDSLLAAQRRLSNFRAAHNRVDEGDVDWNTLKEIEVPGRNYRECEEQTTKLFDEIAERVGNSGEVSGKFLPRQVLGYQEVIEMSAKEILHEHARYGPFVVLRAKPPAELGILRGDWWDRVRSLRALRHEMPEVPRSRKA